MKLLENGNRCAVSDIPIETFEDFRAELIGACGPGRRARVVSFFALRGGEDRLVAAVADDAAGTIGVLSALVGRAYPSLTPDLLQMHLFERQLFEDEGLRPEGHPWLKPVRNPFSTEFFRLQGGESHEVAVGPVHAGVIEPGHFRFQCYGENVEHLEIALGYQKRGIAKALAGGPDSRTVHFMETAAGDTSVGHGLAYARIFESLAGAQAPARAEALRAIALELERTANHVGDLGALSGDVGYLPTQSFCGRLRGEFLNLTAELCGNRFGRGFVRPGGTAFDIDAELAGTLAKKIQSLIAQTDEALDLLWGTSSVLARFERTGIISGAEASELGLVGPAARACGLDLDARSDHPTGMYRYTAIPVSTFPSGDVYARAMVRTLEYRRSAQFILEGLASLPSGGVCAEPQARLSGGTLAIALVEGWRGEICHCAVSGKDGRFLSYQITDPSFHNWFGLALALRGQQISDFPLCNKSFNLSYCGFDL
jgi:Ni,Fe-hydrogenase III large subunit